MFTGSNVGPPPIVGGKGTDSGIYALQLRKKLLEQQLQLVQGRYDKVASIVERKHRRKAGAGPEQDEKKHAKQHHSNKIPGQNGAPPIPKGGEAPLPRIPGGGWSPFDIRTRAAELQLLPPPEDVVHTASTFKPHGTIHQLRMKSLLRDKHLELEKKAAQEAARKRPPPKPIGQDNGPPPLFLSRYSMGEIPCSIEHGTGEGLALLWVCPLKQLDYQHYLPIFAEGARCKADPCQFMAQQGLLDLLEAAEGDPGRVLPSLKEVVKGLRAACQTRIPKLLIYVCRALEALVRVGPEVGEALIRHYKMVLNILNLHVNETRNLGDGMDYKQRTGGDLGEVIQSTLNTLERGGGPAAFAAINYSVPTYTSCI